MNAIKDTASNPSEQICAFKIEIRWRSTFGVDIPLPIEEGMLRLEPEFILEAIASFCYVGNDEPGTSIVAMRLMDEKRNIVFEGYADEEGDEGIFIDVNPYLNIEDPDLLDEAAELLDALAINIHPADVSDTIRVPFGVDIGDSIHMSEVATSELHNIFFHAVRTTSLLEPGVSLTNEVPLWTRFERGFPDQTIKSKLTTSFVLARPS